MLLNFLGRGSCFADDHNSAFFVTEDNDFVLIDCSEQTFQRLKNEFIFSAHNNIYVYITHTHTDHINGLGALIHYVYYVYGKQLMVIAPSLIVMNDIKKHLRIEGVESFKYSITHTLDFITSLLVPKPEMIPQNVYGASIPTEHTLPLKDKTFGYRFNIRGVNVVYTGDTAILDPFFVHLDKGSEFYVDTSVIYKSDVHLWLFDMLPTLKELVSKEVKVYLMHLDNIERAHEAIRDIPGIDIVSLY